MCGIVGMFGRKNCFLDIAKALEVLRNRGKDGVGISDGKKSVYAKSVKLLKKLDSVNLIGHNLHAVVNNVQQPIQGKFVANCEIYNWEMLSEKYNFNSGNDADLILNMIERQGIHKLASTIQEIDGVYAFAYLNNSKLYLARDILGVKPLWYSNSSGFGFASEKKALEAAGFTDIEELNPRTILIYDIVKCSIRKLKRKFFAVGHLNQSKEKIFAETERLVLEAIRKRLPSEKFGILFSGGIDSTFLAYVCKKIGREFICYTAALEEKGMGEAEDLVYATKVANKLGLNLKVMKLSLKEVREYLSKICPLIEDNNVVKVGVGLTFYAACELAKKDKIKVIFSGLGSEEIFAGYERHKKSNDINKECRSGLLKMYERDLYRDDVITMYNSLELRVPFLDKKLVEYALKIPVSFKLDDNQNKIIIREIAKKIGVPAEFADRKKKAAQYGSKFDRAIEKLAKREGYARKSEFLWQFYKPPNVKLGVLWSSGKDSAYAAYLMKKQNYQISCLISLKSKNPDSYMFHTPAIDLVGLHAEAMGVPIIIQDTIGEKEKELLDLKKALLKAKKEYGISGVVSGALFSNYQRERIEKACDELELKIFSPLWHIDQEKEMRLLMKEGFKIIFSSVAAYGLDKSWIGREITFKDVDRLVDLHNKYKINVAGEGGEFESLVLDCPMFDKRVKIVDSSILEEGESAARIIVKKAKLESK